MEIISNNPPATTAFYGDTIKASCNQLIELFGDYGDSSDEDKINFEWDLIIKDIPFSIYDWREPWLDEYMVTDYHIGARNKEESRVVKDLLDMYLKNNN